MTSEEQQARGRRRRPRRDLGRLFARFLCAVFALVGAVPLGGGLLLRSEPLKVWAADETSRLLRQELGLEASFSVELSLIPLRLAVTNLTVPALDGGTPAVQAELAAISPRFFSLLAGRIDVGDIELENTQVRLVVSEGKVANVSYRFPETKDDEPTELKRAPFRSLAITNATVDVEMDGNRIVTRNIDVDAFAEQGLSFDVALRTGESEIDSTHRVEPRDRHDKIPPFVASDEDRLCALDVRLFLSREEIVVRRLSLLGALDKKNEAGTRPSCGEKDDERLALRLSQVKIGLTKDGAFKDLRGHVLARAPLRVADRLVPSLRGTGWAGFSGDIATSADSKLPEVSGQLTGAGLSLSGYVIAADLSAQVLITGDVVQVPSLHALWGNGRTDLTGLRLQPFEEKIPVSVERLVTRDVDFPGVMRDVDVTAHSWVDWNFGDTVVTKVKGTLAPFYLDGGVEADTRDFVVWDRGFDDPAHKYMVGLKRAHVNGRWRAHPEALEFYNTDVRFGESHLPVDLVRIPFSQNGLIVRLKEGGGPLDLADVSPIAAVELSGKSKLYVALEGPNLHPVLEGTLEVDDLVVGGFAAGDIKNSKVHFEPLFVEFTDLIGRKGEMDYHLPSAKLDFGGDASVEFTSAVTSKSFDVEEFFDTFHFDEDPRFSDIKGTAQVSGRVRYLLGGPEDPCGAGHLLVSGSAELSSADLFEEKYNGGRAQFEFDWFDMDASTRGMRVSVPSLSLTKGSGSLFGSLEMHPGGILSGDFVATQIPVSRIDALGSVMGQADGFVTGTGQLSGTADALSFTAAVNVTEVKAGTAILPPSHLAVKLVPAPPTKSAPDLGTTGCGRPIPAPYTLADYEADRSDGEFILQGDLFGNQIQFQNLSITRQNKKIVKGKAAFRQLDVGAIFAFVMGGAPPSTLPTGTISGDIDLERVALDDVYSSKGTFTLTEALLDVGQVKVSLYSNKARLNLENGQFSTENLSLKATTEGGQDGILDARLKIERGQQIDATFDLRPTSLGVVAPAIEGLTRADGKLSARFSLSGALTSPKLGGFIRVEEGKLSLSGFSSPVTDLFVNVGLDDAGLHVERGEAKWGGGTLVLGGEAPLLRGEIGPSNLTISARGVTLPLDEGVRVGFDADLKLALASPEGEETELPSLTGSVDILSASYKKPMRVTADISTLAARGEKTRVEGYDASKDKLRLDVLVRSGKPLRVENELVLAVLRIDPAGLRLTGTNQRFGAVGSVEVEQGGQVFLRQNEFEVQRGVVRFNDPTRLRPEVDVTAVTEYRRYEDRGATQGGQAQQAAASSSASGAPVAGNWRILLRAYGPPDDLKVDLNSDPPLAQDDIFLLLTVGLTRTELEQTQSSVGSSVALEALGSLSGAESVVTKTVPVDEFRFGSSYSSRSGRTEPTVTIGKRLSRRIRASVTTSLSDTSEVRSNIEYRATESLSVEGSYDNARDVASAAGGNLGGDVRWRLEFQ
jgi:translocation and assembly module TamB